MVDACAFSVPGDGGTVDDVTGNETGPDTPPVAYDGPCSFHGNVPEVTLARANAEGSPVTEANAWLRLPPVGCDGAGFNPYTDVAAVPAASFVAWRNHVTDLVGTVTRRGVTERFEGKGIEDRTTHTRLYVRLTGPAASSPAASGAQA